jgi:gluconokinase
MTVMNINVHTTPADLLRASMEALAYQLGDVYKELQGTLKMGEMPTVVGSGGALLGFPTLQSIIADTIGNAIYCSRDSEASARGAALLALESLGVIPDLSKVAPSLEEPVQPNAERGKIYRKAAQRQKELYHKLLGE